MSRLTLGEFKRDSSLVVAAILASLSALLVMPGESHFYIGIVASHFLLICATRANALPVAGIVVMYGVLLGFVYLFSFITQHSVFLIAIAVLVSLVMAGVMLWPHLKAMIAYTLMATLFSVMILEGQAPEGVAESSQQFILAMAVGAPWVVLYVWLFGQANHLKPHPRRAQDIALVCACSAVLVIALLLLIEALDLPYALWWAVGTISMLITGLDSHMSKLKDRTIGVIAGTALAFALSFVLPLPDDMRRFVVFLIFLTLLIDYYRVAYFLRCTLLMWFVFEEVPNALESTLRILAVVTTGMVVMVMMSLLSKVIEVRSKG